MAHVIGRVKVKDYDQFEKAFAAKAEHERRGAVRVFQSFEIQQTEIHWCCT